MMYRAFFIIERLYMNIKKITIILGCGTDKCILHTDLPPNVWPFTQNATVVLEVVHDYGEKYVKENFKNIPYEVIDSR